LKNRKLGEFFLVFQRKIGHALHFFFFGKKRPNGNEAKSAEKQQQRRDSEPLNAVEGLQDVFEHDFVV
jgi:hypothetical protein